ncbi:TIGR04540 family protein [Halobacillus salinarum]|uniref:TIGR04540 family protein n=1 Tax=Halobacillus salinarum TaxID=2932257 RepID=A0ABY4EMF3_9BACI|nr:TIGR04540 family protein [Halobacillus salinarum]UOQ44834.1 TIGR04540 family protein [Halobacillus salinarum]
MSEVDWMGIKLFHKTQRDLAVSINSVIDQYWDDKIDELEMIKTIQNLHEVNQSKMVKDGRYTTIISQQCGKKRLEVVDQVINKFEID